MNTRADDEHDKRNAISFQRFVMPFLQACVLAAIAAQTAGNASRDAKMETMMGMLIKQEVLQTQMLATVSSLNGDVSSMKQTQTERGPIIQELSRFKDNYLQYHYQPPTRTQGTPMQRATP